MTKCSPSKTLYNQSDLGRLQAYIRRFHNITELKDAFDKSQDFFAVSALQKVMSDEIERETDLFTEIEKKFIEDKKAYEKKLDTILVEKLTKIADVMKEFEKNYGNK